MSDTVCERLNALLRDQLKVGFERNLDGLLQLRGRELWMIGIDAQKRQMTDICGTIGVEQMEVINGAGFLDTDAGFRADAHERLPIEGKMVDIFLLNAAHFSKPDSFMIPLIVHELAHYLEQIGEKPNPSIEDAANAGAILVSLRNNVRRLHTIEWAQFLAMAARRIVQSGQFAQGTIREFAEASIPYYDRTGSISIRE